MRLPLITLTACLCPGILHAQGGFHLQPITGVLGSAVSTDRYPSLNRLNAREWVRLSFRGDVVNPRVVRFRIELRPTFNQSRYSDLAGDGGSNGRNLGAQLEANLLDGAAVSGRVRYVRDWNRSGGIGRHTGSTNGGASEHITAGLRWSNPLMPTEFEFARGYWGTEVFDGVAEREVQDRYQHFRLWGYNRKTTFSAEQRAGGTGPFASVFRLAQFDNRQEWGKGSRSVIRLQGQSRSADRSPTSSSVTTTGTVHLAHTGALSSDWAFTGVRGSTGARGYWSRGLGGGITVRVLQGLSAGTGWSWYVAGQGAARQTVVRIQPRAGLHLRLPLGASLRVSGNAGWERLTRSAGGDPYVSVVRESHTVDQTRTFYLANPRIDPASLLLTGPNGEVYTEALDFTTVLVGDLLQVVVLPGGRLTVGQVVFADYRYETDASGAGTLIVADYSGELAIRWLQVYVRRNLRDPGGPRAGTPGDPLRYYRQTIGGVRATLPLSRVTITGMAERQERIDDGLTIRASQVSGSVSARATARLGLSLATGYSMSEGTTGRSTVTSLSAGLGLAVARALSFNADMTAFRSTEQLVTRRTQLSYLAHLEWRPGLLRVTAVYRYRDWRTTYLASDTRTGIPAHTLGLQATRSF